MAKERTLLWYVEKYSYCWHEEGVGLSSPRFPADGLEGTEWNLVLYPRGLTGEDEGFISLYLHRHTFDERPVRVSVKFELSFLAADGSPLHSARYERAFGRGSGHGCRRFLKRSEVLQLRKDEYLPRGTLAVRCRIWRGKGRDRRLPTVCARTRIGVERVSFVHKVEHFCWLQPKEKNTIEIRSPSKNDCLGWSSVYSVYTLESCLQGRIVVRLKIYTYLHTMLCELRVSLVDKSGNRIGCGEADYRYDDTTKDTYELPLILTRETILSEEWEYLPDEKLTLFCECVCSAGLEFERIEEIPPEMPVETAERTDNQEVGKVADGTTEKASSCPSVSEDMKSFFLKQSLSDVRLETRTKSFPAHRLVLCVRSPVFHRMLTGETREGQGSCIEIDDLGDEEVRRLLLFLYSDDAGQLDWGTAARLYCAAHRYEVGGLGEVCSAFLLSNLTPSKAAELLLLSDTHADTRLRGSVEDFILEHEDRVFGSEEWENLMETHPLLVMKAMHLKYKRKKGRK